ncbi:MAG: WXG100 family type VII secretion target, partial [Dietzia sp.]|nr:WXG100 family type VII secretion target [Dietzia sp.]
MTAMRSLSGRTDATYAPVAEVFDNLSHAEIHQAVRQLDPAALAGAAETFLTTATGLGDGVEIAHGEIRAAIADGWRGAAAQQAADAVRDFEQAGRRIADVLTAVGVRLSQAGDAAESIRAAVSEPVGTQPDPDAALLDSEQAANNAALARDAENARLDAVQAMETIYAGAFLPTGSGVPAFTGITTETGTAATGSAPSSTTPSAGIPQSAAVIASTTAPATTAAATVPAGYSPVAGPGTTPASNGVPTIGPAAAPGTPATGTGPASAPAAANAPSLPLASSGGASATTPASATASAAAPVPASVVGRARTSTPPGSKSAPG